MQSNFILTIIIDLNEGLHTLLSSNAYVSKSWATAGPEREIFPT